MPKSNAEFADITPDALNHCLEFGASKISGYLTAGEIEFLRHESLNTINAEDQKLAGLARLISIFNITGLPNVKIKPAGLYPTNSGFHTGVHTDTISLGGISLLIPFRGPDATFEAGSVASRAHGQFPDYVTTYGQGDVMLLRQYVTSYNGAQVNYLPAYHQGICDEPRFIVAVDLNDPNVQVDFTQ